MRDTVLNKDKNLSVIIEENNMLATDSIDNSKYNAVINMTQSRSNDQEAPTFNRHYTSSLKSSIMISHDSFYSIAETNREDSSAVPISANIDE